ncbi:MAG: hypothetical protein EBR84_03255, partial [Actinobacteria bacterium]|nr:hypothetical protein [Actinomycetota bacterium]
FVNGRPGVPKFGMQEIPRQLAAQLQPDTIFLNTKATEVSARKVVTSQGEISCRAVIVATDAIIPSVSVPQMNSVTTWYHLADCQPTDLTNGLGTLVVDGKRYEHNRPDPKRPVVNTVCLSNAAPSYAPEGRVLISTSTLGLPGDSETEQSVRSHLASLYGVPTAGWTFVANYPIANALPAMLPPHQVKRSAKVADGIYVAGDHLAVSSINGAFASGRRAAEALLIDGL